MKNLNVPNYHVIEVKYLGATNTNGSRVKMTSARFKVSKTISYDYQFDNTLEIAEDWLSKNGYTLIGHAEGNNCYFVITSTFKSLKD